MLLSNLDYHLNDSEDKNNELQINENKSYPYPLNNKQRKKLQHEIKLYLIKYFKSKLGKSADFFKVIIWNDMLIIRSEKFLTEPEKFITQTPTGCKLVKAARMQVAKQNSLDNLRYFEEKLGAKCIQETYDVDAKSDFFVHVIIFDRVLIEQ